MTLPLTGLRVVDFGDAWSSPFACTMLADAGADVIRVEDIHRQLSTLRGPTAPSGPLDGYPDRDPGDHPWNRYYLMNNSERNKQGITLDLNHRLCRDVLAALVGRCDIFVTNYSPKAVRDLNLTFDDLSRQNKRLVYAHVTGYGCEGRMANTAALGSTIDAWSGHMGVRGYPDTAPYDTALSYLADSAGAVTLVVALMSALELRDKTGTAQCIELALGECLIQYLAQPMMETVVTGLEPRLFGNGAPDWAPQGAYPCRGDDRWITISAMTDEQWTALANVLGLEPLQSQDERLRSREDLDRIIASATTSWDGEELMAELQAAGVPAMFVYLDSELTDRPELTSPGFLQTAFHTETGLRQYPGPVWQSTVAPMSLRQPHFGLGEHNHAVICGELGFSEGQYQQMLRDQAIGTRYSFWPS